MMKLKLETVCGLIILLILTTDISSQVGKLNRIVHEVNVVFDFIAERQNVGNA